LDDLLRLRVHHGHRLADGGGGQRLALEREADAPDVVGDDDRLVARDDAGAGEVAGADGGAGAERLAGGLADSGLGVGRSVGRALVGLDGCVGDVLGRYDFAGRDGAGVNERLDLGAAAADGDAGDGG
jgi:hypothetical protein